MGKNILLAVYRKNCLELLILDEQLQLVKNIVVDDSRREEPMQGGWVQLGEGGFTNANATHHVMVLSIGKDLTFYRIISVEDGYEVVKVAEIQV